MEPDLIVRQFNNKLLQSCSYIIESDYLTLVDPGDSSPLIDYIIDSKKDFYAIILTHCHTDHIYGLSEILKNFPNTPIFCSRLTLLGMYDTDCNLSFIFPDYPLNIPSTVRVNVIKEGDYIISGNIVKVIETPGHADDCLTFIIGNHIFTGDSYIPFSKVFTKWPRSNKALAKMNETKLKEIIKNNKYNVHPGHWK